MRSLRNVNVLGISEKIIAIQGGMGAGISLAPLAGAVAKRGWIGVVSSVALDRMVERDYGLRYRPNCFDAARIEIETAKRLSGGNGLIMLNLMVAIQSGYEELILGAEAGGADGFIVGAGLPLTLPGIVKNPNTLLIPIVSSAKALDIICRRWTREFSRLPDAVVLEGPLAGGHLGFKAEDIAKPEFQLEALLPQVLETAREYGNIPVVVAGGIWDRGDVIRFVNARAAGVQIGIRFAATIKSGASDIFKQRIVEATADNIMVATNPGSPSGMPFRILADSPGYIKALLRDRDLSRCDLCYMLRNRKCPAMDSHDKFCICSALWSAVCNDLDGDAIYTVGANAARVKKIVSVDEVIDELTGITS